MNEDLRLARTHCQQLLGENLVLSNNHSFLVRLLEVMRQTAVLEGCDYGIIPFEESMPAELMEDALAKVGKRYKELALVDQGPAAPPPIRRSPKVSRAARKKLREVKPNEAPTG